VRLSFGFSGKPSGSDEGLARIVLDVQRSCAQSPPCAIQFDGLVRDEQDSLASEYSDPPGNPSLVLVAAADDAARLAREDFPDYEKSLSFCDKLFELADSDYWKLPARLESALTYRAMGDFEKAEQQYGAIAAADQRYRASVVLPRAEMVLLDMGCMTSVIQWPAARCSGCRQSVADSSSSAAIAAWSATRDSGVPDFWGVAPLERPRCVLYNGRIRRRCRSG
jgi:hypothetical protein